MAVGEPPPPAPPHEVTEKQPKAPLVFGSLQIQDPIPPKPSYADILSGVPTKKIKVSLNNSVSIKASNIDGGCNGRVQLKPTSMYQGKPAVILSISDKHSLIQSMKYVLVAKFSHGKPGLASVKDYFAKCNLKSIVNISVFDSKHLILECEAFEDFVKLWMSKNCLVGGFLMRLFKWSEDFHPTFESPICPVWVHLPGLPIYLYQEDILMSIANAIGRPLALDLDNLNRSKLGCATFCVEVDISIEVFDKIWIAFDKVGPCDGKKGLWQKVIYDPLPHYCSRCAHLGHAIDRCLRMDNLDNTILRGDIAEGEGLSGGELGPGGLQGLQGKGFQLQQALSSINHEQNAALETKSGSAKPVTELGAGNERENVDRSCVTVETVHTRIRTDLKDLERKFALNEEVLIEDITLEEGEIDVEALGATVVKAAAAHDNVQVDDNVKGRHQLEGMLAKKLLASNAMECNALEEEVLMEYLELGGSAILKSGFTREVNNSATLEDEDTSLEEGEIADIVDVAVFHQKPRGAAVTDHVVSDVSVPTSSATRTAAAMIAPAGSAPVKSATQIDAAVSASNGSPDAAVDATEELDLEGADRLHKSDLFEQVEDTNVAVETAAQDLVLQESVNQELLEGKELEVDHVTGAVSAADTLVEETTKIDISENTVNKLNVVTVIPSTNYWEAAASEKESSPTRTAAASGAPYGHYAKENKVSVEAARVVEAAAHHPVEQGLASTSSSQGFQKDSVQTTSITPQKLSSAAAEFTPKWAVLVEELVEGKKQPHPVLNEKEGEESLQEKSANAGGQVAMVTNYAMDRLNERMRRLRGEPAAPILTPILATSTWIPPSMSKHLARELKKNRKQHRSIQNWQDIEDYSDVESEEGELDEWTGSQRLNGEACLSDEMGDIPRPFKIKSTPNSPKGRNSSYDSSTYLLSRKFS